MKTWKKLKCLFAGLNFIQIFLNYTSYLLFLYLINFLSHNLTILLVMIMIYVVSYFIDHKYSFFLSLLYVYYLLLYYLYLHIIIIIIISIFVHLFCNFIIIFMQYLCCIMFCVDSIKIRQTVCQNNATLWHI